MKNDKPTQEELERFWNWCGFIVTPYEYWDGADKHIYPNDYQYPNKHWGKQPLLTLDNLFKYAVPRFDAYGIYKAKHTTGKHVGWASLNDCISEVVEHEDPALALFWAMQEVIENEGNTV